MGFHILQYFVHSHVLQRFQEYETEIGKGGLVLVDFFAQWCGPCKRISPYIEQLAKEFEGKAVFIKVDVDELADVASKEQISSMPTFRYFKGGKKVADVIGASQDKVRATLESNL